MKTNDIVSQAISYIMQHIEEEITIEDVADACHFSKYYFSRIFKAETGESMYAFIKRMKLEQSAFRMKLERDRTITDIGLDYGYSPSNYSQAFRNYYDTTPIEFRKGIYDKSKTHPFYSHVEVELDSLETCKKKITIQELPERTVLYERRIGNYRELVEEWNLFIEKYKDYQDENTIFIERTFDDPTITDTDNCLYDLGMTVGKDYDLPNTCVIPGGKFAVYRYEGTPERIYNAYQSIFQVWMPAMHKTIDKRYGYDVYRKVDCENMQFIIDLCIPIS